MRGFRLRIYSCVKRWPNYCTLARARQLSHACSAVMFRSKYRSATVLSQHQQAYHYRCPVL